jgi:hypothetical protein
MTKKEKRDFIARKTCDGAAVLSAQADTFAGANVKEKTSACSVRNDGGVAMTIACVRMPQLRSGQMPWQYPNPLISSDRRWGQALEMINNASWMCRRRGELTRACGRRRILGCVG